MYRLDYKCVSIVVVVRYEMLERPARKQEWKQQ